MTRTSASYDAYAQPLPYTSTPPRQLNGPNSEIASFVDAASENHLDPQTVAAFGEEWGKFREFDEANLRAAAQEYFDILSPDCYGPDKKALDLGCGTGRWSLALQDRFGFTEGIDPSEAILVADQLLGRSPYFRATHAGVDHIPFPDESFDFILCLGVLHHVPDTAGAIQKAARKLKPGGAMLIYLYYNLDNRGTLYKLMFWGVNWLRKGISRLPGKPKRWICDLLAIVIYMPLLLLVRLFYRIGLINLGNHLPLSYYANKPFYIIRNDALDRFGTPLEQRFSRQAIWQMLKAAGFRAIEFSPHPPYWHALARK
jgi:ubiquinone/menaquinone biosynthesis C-methylase UbiE